MTSTVPKYKKLAKSRPIVLSRRTIGRNEKIDPIQEQTIFNNIAWITLNRTYLVKGTDPREQTRKIPTIIINIR